MAMLTHHQFVTVRGIGRFRVMPAGVGDAELCPIPVQRTPANQKCSISDGKQINLIS